MFGKVKDAMGINDNLVDQAKNDWNAMLGRPL